MSDTVSQSITVADTIAPSIVCAGPRTIECPATPSFADPTVSDACDANPTVTFADSSAPGTCPQSTVYTRTWTATDHCGNHASCSQSITVVDTTAPNIVCAGPRTIECPATPTFPAPTVSDACDPGPTVTFADSSAPGTCPQSTVYTRTWTATDHCGNHASCSQSITVVDTTAPSIVCAGPQTIECPATPTFPAPTVNDACDPSPTVTFADSSAPGTCPQSTVITRTWTATDHCGNHASCSQSITVVDTTAPNIVCAGPRTIECPATPTFPAPTVSDACDANPTVTFADS